MTTVQVRSTTNVCFISQATAVVALTGPQDEVRRFRSECERRHKLVVQAIDKFEGLASDPPTVYLLILCQLFISYRQICTLRNPFNQRRQSCQFSTVPGRVLPEWRGVPTDCLHTFEFRLLFLFDNSRERSHELKLQSVD